MFAGIRICFRDLKSLATASAMWFDLEWEGIGRRLPLHSLLISPEPAYVYFNDAFECLSEATFSSISDFKRKLDYLEILLSPLVC